MSTVDETLSRLLDGELSGAEEAAIRERIAAEPEVAAAWARMRALRTALEDLDEASPPAWLDAAVLATVARPEGPAARSPGVSRWGWVVAALAAAALAAVLLLPRGGTTPPLRLLDGSEWIDGQVTVLAGDAVVRVDGLALVSVEPRGGPVRVPPQEDAMNPTTHIVAALAGAAVTVAVYEGTARIAPSGAEPVEIAAGETRTVGGSEAVRPVRRVVTTTDPGAPSGTVSPAVRELPASASPEARIAALEKQVEQLEFENALMRGQIVLDQGEVSHWPDEVPGDLEPDAFEARLQSALETAGVGRIEEVDCAEYPCVAFVSLDSELPMEELQPLLHDISEGVGGDGDGPVMQMVRREAGPDGPGAGNMAIAVFPENPPESMEKRVNFRAQSWMETNAGGDPPTP